MRLLDMVAEYVAYKRSLGMRFDTDAGILGSFCRRVGDVPLSSVTADQVRAFLDGDLAVSSYWERKYTALAGLYRFALSRGYGSASPLPSRHPQLPPPFGPVHLFAGRDQKLAGCHAKRLWSAGPAGGLCISCPTPAALWRLSSTRRSTASDDDRCRS